MAEHSINTGHGRLNCVYFAGTVFDADEPAGWTSVASQSRPIFDGEDISPQQLSAQKNSSFRRKKKENRKIE